MIRSFEIKQDLLTPVPDGDYRTYDVNYVYGNNAKIISDLKNQYDFDLDEVLARDDEVVCDYVFQSSGKKFLAISFLLPELNKGLYLDNLVTPIALLIFKGKLIIVTAHRIAFISQLLTQFQLQDSSNFVVEVTLKILKTSFELMTNDLRQLKDKIDGLETSISESGPVKPVFGELLTLQKYMITLSSTYDANKKIVDFLDKHFSDIESFNRENEKIIMKLYDKIDTMNRILKLYGAYLDNFETMINNMSSFQLNSIMKVLTEISIVLTIPTMVYGLWGINVPVPFAKSDAGILAVVIISFILSVVVWLWLRRRKYL